MRRSNGSGKSARCGFACAGGGPGFVALLLAAGCASAPKQVLVKPAVDSAEAACQRLRQTTLDRPIRTQISAQKRAVAAAMAANDRPLALRRAKNLAEACRTEAQQRIDVAALVRDLHDRRAKLDRRRYAQFSQLIHDGDYGNAIVCGEALLQGVPIRCDETMGAGRVRQPYRPTQTVRLRRGVKERPAGARDRLAPAAAVASKSAPPAVDAASEPTPGAPSVASPAEAAVDQSPESSRSRLWFWTAVGVGGSALVGGAILAGLAKSRHSDLEQRCPDCSQADVDAGKGMAIGADVLLGVGLAAAVGAVVVWFVQPRQPERATAERARSRPAVAVFPRGVTATWAF